MKALAIVAALAGIAHADAKVDWGRGLVIADGVGVADRHAPSPAVARNTARRGADDAAKRAIAAALPAIPLASGGTLGERAKDPAVRARIDAAVGRALTLAADPSTDGSWRVSLGVPLEALRQAVDGPRVLAGADTGPAIVLIETSTTPPALGYRIGTAPISAIWIDGEDGTIAARTTAVTKDGVLVLAKPLGSPSTLYMIVTTGH